MALFGGGFATGLITGLAESANEALKNDIERINSRVDRISEFKVKRAIEEQDKRRAELDEVEKALQEGYALFGGESNKNAADFAAGLLKESGSLEAYKRRIQELAKAKNDTGVDLGSFMERAGVDSPAGTISDYANAYVGSQKTFASDYRMPEGMKPVGGLVSKVVGKPIDTMALAGAKAQEELTARGVGEVKFESVPLPTITFQAEKFKMSQMSASERITYLNDKLANPSNSEERNQELQGMLNTALNTADKTGSLTTKIDAKKQLLERAKTEADRKILIDEISELTFQKETTEAEAEGNAIAAIDARIKRQQYLGNTENVKELVKKKKELTGDEPSFANVTAELEADLMKGLANGSIIEGSDAHKAAMDEIEKRRDIEQNVKGAGNANPTEIRGAQTYFNNELRLETQKRLGALGSSYVTILDLVQKGTNVVNLSNEERTIYLRGQEIEAEVAQEVASKITSQISEEDWPELYTQLRIKGLLPSDRQTTGDVIETGSGDQPVSTVTDTSTEPSVSDQTSQAIPTDTKPEQTVTDVSGEVTEDEKLQYPKTVEGALSITQGISSVGGTPQDAYQAAMDLHGDEQFATTVEFIASKDDTGLDGLEKRIAEMALQGLNANQITQQLKQVEYAGDTSMDVASISSTVAKVLSELNPESRNRRILNQQRASEAKQQQLEDARKTRPSLKLPSGLMSKQ